jgi:hypothetical protein
MPTDLLLNIGDDLACIGLEPAPVQAFGGQSKLDDQVAREVLRLDFTAFLAPKREQSALIIAHDDPGVGAADEIAPISIPAFCGPV